MIQFKQSVPEDSDKLEGKTLKQYIFQQTSANAKASIKKKTTDETSAKIETVTTRSRARLKSIGRKQNSAIKMAQEVLAKNWGVMKLKTHQKLEIITMQQYLETYKKPLTEPTMEAIRKLSRGAELKKKRKETARPGRRMSNK